MTVDPVALVREHLECARCGAVVYMCSSCSDYFLQGARLRCSYDVSEWHTHEECVRVRGGL